MNATRSAPTADPAAIRAALALILEPGQVTEVRAFAATTPRDAWPKILSGYFDDAAKLAAAVGELRSAEGIYIVPNPVKPDLLSRANNRLRGVKKGEATSDTHVTRRRFLLVDIDADRESGISSTDDEHAAALAVAGQIAEDLGNEGWPRPLVADSGNGGHLMYRVDLAADQDAAELFDRLLAALAERYDDAAEPVRRWHVDQTVKNPSRLWKLYGTLAAKGDDTRVRPHRMARLLSAPDPMEVVTREQLEALAGPKPEPPASVNGHANGAPKRSANGSTFDVAEWVTSHGLDVGPAEPWTHRGGTGTRWVFNACPFNADHTDGSAFVAKMQSGAGAFGCHHNGCRGKTWTDLRAMFDGPRPVTNGRHRAAQPGQPCPTGEEPAGRPADFYSATEPLRDRPPVQPAAPPRTEPFAPFPIGELPQPLRAYVENAAATIGCDHSYIALPLLAALGQAIGTARRCKLKRGWYEPPIIWTAIVGDSGSLKSPAIEAGTRHPRRFQETAYVHHAKEMAKYQEEVKAWKATPKDARGTEPAEPEPCHRIVLGESTIEAAIDRLSTAPRGLILVRDELSGWMGGFNQYKAKGGGDVAHWLECFGARSITIDRKTADRKTIYIPRAAVCVTGGIQPGTLGRLLTPEFFVSGFAARLFFAYPPKRPKRWTEDEIDPATDAAVADVFARLYGLSCQVDINGAPEPVDVVLSHWAKGAWVDFVNRNGDEQYDRADEQAIAAWSKLEGGAARLALILHMVKVAADDPTVRDHEIDHLSLASGIRLSQWFGHEAERIYTALRETDEGRADRLLCDYIRERGGVITARDLQRSNAGRYPTVDSAEHRLMELVDAGLGHWEVTPSTGRPGRPPPRRFRLLDVEETEPADDAEARPRVTEYPD